jgi:PhnB protein
MIGHMARTSTYLNFARDTEAAFNFYGLVFGTTPGGLMRFRDMPASDGAPPLQEADLDLLVHIELEILGGHMLMGTDAPESMGFALKAGTNMHLNLEPGSVEEANRLFDALSAGGTVGMPLAPMFWGGVFGSFTDRYGLQWMINCAAPST